MTKRQLPTRPANAPHGLGHLNVHADPGARYITEATHVATIHLPLPRHQVADMLRKQRALAPVLTGMDARAAELLRIVQAEADLSRLASHHDSPYLTIGASLPLNLEVELDGKPLEADAIDGAAPEGGGPYHAYAQIVLPTGRMQNGKPAVLQCPNGPIFCHLVIDVQPTLAPGDEGADGPFVHTDTKLTCRIAVVVSPDAELTEEAWLELDHQ